MLWNRRVWQALLQKTHPSPSFQWWLRVTSIKVEPGSIFAATQCNIMWQHCSWPTNTSKCSFQVEYFVTWAIHWDGGWNSVRKSRKILLHYKPLDLYPRTWILFHLLACTCNNMAPPVQTSTIFGLNVNLLLKQCFFYLFPKDHFSGDEKTST